MRYKPLPLPPLEYVKSRLDYDPVTGVFTWRSADTPRQRWTKSWEVRNLGKTAGTPDSHGHIRINLNGQLYGAHRLAWYVMTGEEHPEIDHRDRNRQNNSFENLRPATGSENNGNQSLRSNNTSGLKGVSWSKSRRKWVAQIGGPGTGGRRALGRFSSREAAHAAYMEAARELYGEFHTNGVEG